MVLIAGSSHIKLAQEMADILAVELVIAGTQRFNDQELKVQINYNLYAKDVMILQSISKPANDHLMELLLLADTAKRAGSSKITALIPYLGYSRQDRPSYKSSPVSASLVARLIESAGIDKVITVDLHSKQAEGFFKITLQSLDPISLFVPLFDHTAHYVVVSPDIGSLPRARAFAEKLNADLVVINKSRKLNGKCRVEGIIGEVNGKDCIVIDDIVDTGETLRQAAKFLKNRGANSVSACVTHGVFSGNCIQKLKNVGFSNFYITDTIKQSRMPAFIKLISIKELLAKRRNC